MRVAVTLGGFYTRERLSGFRISDLPKSWTVLNPRKLACRSLPVEEATIAGGSREVSSGQPLPDPFDRHEQIRAKLFSQNDQSASGSRCVGRFTDWLRAGLIGAGATGLMEERELGCR